MKQDNSVYILFYLYNLSKQKNSKILCFMTSRIPLCWRWLETATRQSSRAAAAAGPVSALPQVALFLSCKQNTALCHKAIHKQARQDDPAYPSSGKSYPSCILHPTTAASSGEKKNQRKSAISCMMEELYFILSSAPSRLW